MNKLILNFKSKESKKIKEPKNFLGGKGANLSEMGRMGPSCSTRDLQSRQRFVNFFIKIKKN
jgi:hypothetical protein